MTTYEVLQPILRDGVQYAAAATVHDELRWRGLPEGQPCTRITLDEDDPGTRRLLRSGFIAAEHE